MSFSTTSLAIIFRNNIKGVYKLKKNIATIWLVLMSSSALAGDLSGANILGELRIGAGVIRIASDGDSWKDPDNCTGNESGQSSQVYLLESNPNFKEIYSAVLAARMAKSRAQFYVNGCHTINGKSHPVVSTVYL